MNKLVQYVILRYKAWCQTRLLRKHNCTTQDEYDRRYDPDIKYRARFVKDFYHGYETFNVIDHGDEIYHSSYWDTDLNNMKSWLKNNCKFKYRIDTHRIVRNFWNDWEFNDLGGLDYVVVAFKCPKEATMFLLKYM